MPGGNADLAVIIPAQGLGSPVSSPAARPSRWLGWNVRRWGMKRAEGVQKGLEGRVLLSESEDSPCFSLPSVSPALCTLVAAGEGVPRGQRIAAPAPGRTLRPSWSALCDAGRGPGLCAWLAGPQPQGLSASVCEGTFLGSSSVALGTLCHLQWGPGRPIHFPPGPTPVLVSGSCCHCSDLV